MKNGITWLLNPPKVTPENGRVVKKLDLVPKKHTDPIKSAQWKKSYYARREAAIARKRQRRAEAKLARLGLGSKAHEHAAAQCSSNTELGK